MRRDRSLYSRFIALLKIGLPTVAIGILAAVFLVKQQDELAGGLVFTQADLDALDSGLRVTAPQLSGATARGDRYSLTAAMVIPTDASLSKLDVQELSGTIVLIKGPSIELDAKSALLDLTAQHMVLSEGVNLRTSDGYRFSAPRVEADLRSATLIGTGPINASGPLGEITAGHLRIAPGTAGSEVTADNQMIWFSEGVTLRFVPEAGKP